MELTKRKQKILSSVVDSYISSGEPVGSKAIAQEIGVSSATVRNEMADLINLGLLKQPHTSAGRVPSQRGYREYLETREYKPPLSDKDKKYYDSYLVDCYEPEKLLKAAANVSAAASKFAGLATTPGGNSAKIKAVQFVQTSRRTAMLVMMSSLGTIKSRVFYCDFDITPEITRQFFRAFNKKLIGVNVQDITLPFIQTMGASLGELSILAGSALMALLEVAKETAITDVIIRGQTNLLFSGDFVSRDIRDIINFLDKKERVVALLNQSSNKLTVLIGREMKILELSNASIIFSRYSIDGEDAGAIAVLGPVRMDYNRNMQMIDYLSESVSRLLTKLMYEE